MTDSALDQLVRWYAIEWMDEASGVEQLHDPHPGPGDLTGAPEWSQRFRHYILDPADSIDEQGFYRKPLRAALLAVAKTDTDHYRVLTKLRETWDAERTGWRCGVDEVAILAALRNLRRLYQVRAR